jgi:hypothetical protein
MYRFRKFRKFQCDHFGSDEIQKCIDCRRSFYLNEFRYIGYYIGLILSIFIFINILNPDIAWIYIWIVFGILMVTYLFEGLIEKFEKKWNVTFVDK